MDDKRIFARIDARFPLRFLNPQTGREGEAQTVDVSANGVGFTTKERLSAEAPLEMWLNIPDQREPLYARGEVVWFKPLAEAGQQRVGVRLENARLMGLARVLWVKRQA